MKLIVGLGNPGRQYENTRHNIGFRVIDALVRKIQNSDIKYQGEAALFKNEKKFDSETVRLNDSIFCKPQTFMNGSGAAVSKIANFYKIKTGDIYVIHDDLDIVLGEYKIQKGVGPHLHYGIKSIDGSLSDNKYWRVRVGVDGRGDDRVPGDDYVLQNFEVGEKEVLDKTIDKILIELVDAVSK